MCRFWLNLDIGCVEFFISKSECLLRILGISVSYTKLCLCQFQLFLLFVLISFCLVLILIFIIFLNYFRQVDFPFVLWIIHLVITSQSPCTMNSQVRAG